jgi:hypothetical protein
MKDEQLTTIERALAMPLRSVIIGPDLHAALTALVAELAARPTPAPPPLTSRAPAPIMPEKVRT